MVTDIRTKKFIIFFSQKSFFQKMNLFRFVADCEGSTKIALDGLLKGIPHCIVLSNDDGQLAILVLFFLSQKIY